ncbi:YbjN domain-containing protein [Falsirhodobacter sp. alg1]|uniref:YbjN domain-containing protein n=1 Tax=Falsirhodobacter sp. alg1 TaxID=1472418 RepID=UPI0005EED5FB|nr:YbjN domain-containing protein [Falsirhodobacter sp. alg1]
MSMLDTNLVDADLHPIDAVESVAQAKDWSFDRLNDDRIALTVTGLWRTYSLTLAWSAADETLRLICTFEMDPPKARRGMLYDLLNRVNDSVWCGCFSYWTEQKMMVWRYGLLLSGGQTVGPEQIERLMHDAVSAAERFYPAFQLVAWGNTPPAQAIHIAIAETYGRA